MKVPRLAAGPLAGTLRMVLEGGDRREGLDEFRLILVSIKERVTQQQP